LTRAAAFALAVALALASPAARAHDAAPVAKPDPGGPAPLFEPPAPGSYELPPIDRVAEHVLLDHEGLPTRLPGVAAGQVAVVSFVYRDCGQACPAALATLQRLDRALADDARLAGRVRQVTVSFDPAHDTPERMAELRAALAPRGRWSFVTAPDLATLEPVLDDYGQRVTRRLVPSRDAPASHAGSEHAASSEESEILSHVLKVFLVDESRRIRNVYSVGLMDPRLIVNDIQTVLAD
jgi:cytochrome oxidase Cu insertion factor (SCO1/SenC/PrrC family)